MEELLAFNRDIDKIMTLIEKGEEIEGRFVFNAEVYKKYADKMIPGSTLYFAVPFWVTLDEYLNSEQARILHMPSSEKENLLSEYEGYQGDFKKTRQKEKHLS